MEPIITYTQWTVIEPILLVLARKKNPDCKEVIDWADYNQRTSVCNICGEVFDNSAGNDWDQAHPVNKARQHGWRHLKERGLLPFI